MSAQVLSDDDIRARLSTDLPQWGLVDGAIQRTYRTHGWKGTLMVVNTIGHLAEAAWHHPDLHASYASVIVRLNTHDAGGVTEMDLELARKIEDVVMWRPAQDSPLAGTPGDPAYAYIRYD